LVRRIFLKKGIDNSGSFIILVIVTIMNIENPGISVRMTPQRRVILEELQKVESHPTADEIYEMARRRLPRISLGTVYRNLEILARQGLIRQLDTGPQKRFDGTVREHYHIRCVRCGAMVDCPLKPVISFRGEFRGLSEFAIQGHHLEFLGFCPKCKSGVARSGGTARKRESDHNSGKATPA